jgi:hypothetical protein
MELKLADCSGQQAALKKESKFRRQKQKELFSYCLLAPGS